ncbi:transient receptor potential cation channel subfamily M member 2-like [Saccoglossus kowalevskii]
MRIIDGERRIIDGEMRIIDGERRIIDGERRIIDGERRIIDGEMRIIDDERRIIDGERRIIDGERRIIDGEMRIIDGEMRIIDGEMRIIDGERPSCSSDHATLLLMTLWDINTEDAEYMLENNITKQCISYKTIMMSALVLGKASFLEICLENGMPLQPFCDKTTLGHLYRSVLFYNELIEDDTSLLRLVKRKLNLNKSGNDDLLLCKVADFAARLTRGVFHPNYIDLSEYTPSVKDLYVWALLCGRYEMAKLLWNIAPDHIALALLGSRILRSLSKFASKYEERHLGEDLEEQGIEFENLASNAIQVCYQKDTEKSHKLLHKPICNLNKNHKFTCLTLAWACHAMKFISMSCCQTKLTRIWNQDSGKNGVVEGSVHFLSPKFQFFFNLISYIDRVGLRRKLISFCFRQWNVIKVTMLALFWISVLARIVVPDNYFVFVRVLYSFTLCASYLNLLPMGFANDKLGPKLVMIRGMVMELFIFLVILLVFIFGYGAMMEALLHPNNPHSKMETLPHLLYKPFFQILGDLLTDEYEGDDIACESLTNEGCIIQVLIPILTGIYVLITNVLLLNLLIAVFSFYIEDIQARSEVVWAFYRYGLIMEYKNKVPFFPFGCLFYWPYLMYKCVSSKCYKQKRYTSVPKSESDYELESFEHRGVNQCWRQVKTEVTS